MLAIVAVGTASLGGFFATYLALHGRRWLREQQQPAPLRLGGPAELAADDGARDILLSEGSASPWVRGLAWIARPDTASGTQALRIRLAQAGWQRPSDLAVFLAGRAMSIALFSLAGIGLAWWTGQPLAYILAAGVASAALGWVLPVIAIDRLGTSRVRRIENALPSTLDMLVAAAEAGLGLDMATQRVSDRIHVFCPDLAHELHLVAAQVAAGIPRSQALREFETRVPGPGVRALVKVIEQTARMGTSLGPSLRAHAKLARRQRLLQAEERAAAASPKMTVAMVALILPALFIVLLGPGVISSARTLGMGPEATEEAP